MRKVRSYRLISVWPIRKERSTNRMESPANERNGNAVASSSAHVWLRYPRQNPHWPRSIGSPANFLDFSDSHWSREHRALIRTSSISFIVWRMLLRFSWTCVEDSRAHIVDRIALSPSDPRDTDAMEIIQRKIIETRRAFTIHESVRVLLT